LARYQRAMSQLIDTAAESSNAASSQQPHTASHAYPTALKDVSEDGHRRFLDYVAQSNLLSDNVLPKVVYSGVVRLNLAGNLNLTDRGLQLVAQACGDTVEEIDISLCEKVTDIALGYISMCSLLRTLNIRGCHRLTDLGIKRLFANKVGPSLIELDVSGCLALSDGSCVHIATNAPDLQVFSCSGLLRFTDAGLKAIVQMCKEMRELHCSGLETLTSLVVVDMAALPSISSLNISHCNRVSNRALLALGSSCPQLTALDISGCVALDTNGWEAVNAMKNLQRLGISLLPKMVTSAGVKDLAMSALLYLDISYNPSLEQDVLRSLPTNLCELNVVGNVVSMGISPDVLVALVASSVSVNLQKIHVCRCISQPDLAESLSEHDVKKIEIGWHFCGLCHPDLRKAKKKKRGGIDTFNGGLRVPGS
jgi:hypothetical protein